MMGNIHRKHDRELFHREYILSLGCSQGSLVSHAVSEIHTRRSVEEKLRTRYQKQYYTRLRLVLKGGESGLMEENARHPVA